MLRLASDPIDTAKERRELNNASCGAVVVFEGVVREHNQNRPVVHLEYEAAEELAGAEFQKIEYEARRAFPVIDIRCIHRTGMLAIGDTAVWIGVSAPHRGPAFEACRFVIDELKKRLPVWKKEYYADGESEWLNRP